MYKFISTLLIIAASSTSAFAYKNKTANDILNSGSSPEEIGKSIMVEGDDRDFGFGDFEVQLDMILRNSNGDEITRSQRNKTLEVKDKDKGDKTLIIFDNPRDVKGTAFLTFSNILTADDQWLYLPSLKRVKRISSKNKSGPFVGSEFAYEDISSQEVDKFSYKYLRSEDCGKLKCFVVERYPLYEYSGYTRQLVWIDHEEFRLIKMDFYDRKNELLKTLRYEDYNQYLDRYWRAHKFYMVNHQTGKSTDIVWKDYKFGIGLDENDFTQANLKRVK